MKKAQLKISYYYTQCFHSRKIAIYIQERSCLHFLLKNIFFLLVKKKILLEVMADLLKGKFQPGT